jgi:hypothetical protein
MERMRHKLMVTASAAAVLLSAAMISGQTLQSAPGDSAAKGSRLGDTAQNATAQDTGAVSTIITLTKGPSGVTIVRQDGEKVDTVVKGDTERVHIGFRERIAEWRQKGHGIGGGLTPGVFAVGAKPIKELIARVAPLRGRTFNLHTYNYEPFYMSGGEGYAGLGNGIRLGGGGMSGERHFVSEAYGTDSAVALDIKVSWGGFLIEKALISGPWNSAVGAFLGSGSIDATARIIDRNDYSAFDGDTASGARQPVKARFLYLEAHGGASYTVCPWFHIGATLSVPAFIGPEGFESRTPDFITVNPGVQVRFIFGNLG